MVVRRWLVGTAGLALAAAGGLVPAGSATATTPTVSVAWSSEDGAHRLEERAAIPFATSVPGDADAVVDVDPGAVRQTILGQGAVLESSSVHNIARLSAAGRDQMMHQLFDPGSGNAYDVVRLAMGCPDMCDQAFYTYDDVPPGQTDPDLTRFSIQKDIDSGIVAVARQALEINPSIRFYLSMWSAPAWMKDNGSLIGGGSVEPEHYGVLATYQRRAVEAYQAQGIPIYAMTPQNEPSVLPAYPSGAWTGAQMRDYVKHLGLELAAHGLDTQIWIGDDNPHTLTDFDPVVLADPDAARWVDGIALHDYAGGDPAPLLQDFRAKHPGLPVHLTERSYYGVNGETTTAGSFQAGVRRLIDFYRAGISSWTYWITFLDTDGQPNTGPLDAACCSVPFSAPPGNLDAYTTNRDHHLYGQLSRYVARGAHVVSSSQTSSDVSNVAFRNPDGTVVVVVANGASSARTVALRSALGVVNDSLPPLTVASYRWPGGTTPTDPVVGTFRLENRHDPGHSLQITNERYLDLPDTSNTAVTPTAWNSVQQRWDVISAGDGCYRIVSVSAPTRVLQATGDRYRDWSGVFNVASTPGTWRHDDQLWRFVDQGDGYYRIINEASDAALQLTQDRYAYGNVDEASETVVSPTFWNIPEQQWRLSRVGW